jgi:hypothetical protein
MPSTSNQILSDDNAWAALVDPLSVSDRALLTRFRARMRTGAWAAAEFMDAHGVPVTAAFARRLAFCEFLYATGRISG